MKTVVYRHFRGSANPTQTERTVVFHNDVPGLLGAALDLHPSGPAGHSWQTISTPDPLVGELIEHNQRYAASITMTEYRQVRERQRREDAEFWVAAVERSPE